ncbi:MAG: ABC transporter substrate-binding protein [Ottowia sp.]|uniref:ABC transporter substrate-binding protein n=1 Tax=Ottowia sp. TaxID=1898956 RepID=UPI003C74A4E6
MKAKRGFLVLLLTGGALVGAVLAGKALTPQRTQTIAIVLPREEQNVEAGFRDYLAKRPLPVRFVSVRYSGHPSDAPALIESVRALQPDLIYSWATSTTLALAGQDRPEDAATHIRDIPIVFTEVTDPVGSGLLRQLDPPGRNVTGVGHVAPLPIQLKAMSGYRPFKRLGYLTNPHESNTLGIAEALRRAAPGIGFELLEEIVPLDANGEPDASVLPGMIHRLAEKKADLLYVGPSTFLAFTHRDAVTSAALQARLPTFCATESIVRQSQCMFGLFANGANVGRFAAYKASQILIDRMPVERIAAQTLQGFSLLINMPVAKALDLYPPLALLNVAEVIE